MIYETDLFSFSFVPNWYLQLDALAELALSESRIVAMWFCEPRSCSGDLSS